SWRHRRARLARKLAQHRLTDAFAQLVAVAIGPAEVDTAPHACVVDLLRDCREAGVSAGYAEHRRIGHADLYPVRVEFPAQNSLPRHGKSRHEPGDTQEAAGSRPGAPKRGRRQASRSSASLPL